MMKQLIDTGIIQTLKNGNAKMFYFFLLLFFCGIFFWYFSFNRIRNNHSQTTAIISSCYWQSNGRSASYYVMNFSFIAYDKQYFSKIPVYCQEINIIELRKKMIGRRLPLIYYTKNPENCQILLYASNYADFNVNMPDSLKWVGLFLSCGAKY